MTVRLAQSGDKVIQPTVSVSESSETKIPEEPVIEKKQIKESKAEPEKPTEENIQRLESDQEKMVLDLFDGKYVE